MVNHRTIFLACALLTAFASKAEATRDLVGTRSSAMGGALRAAATGTASVLLNPAAMSLARMYVVGATYNYRGSDSASQLSAAIVDSVTSRYVHAGIFYNFGHASPSFSVPAGDVSQTNVTHEFGVALSLPFRRWLAVGVNARYISHTGELSEDSPDVGVPDISAFGLDIGGVVQLGKMFSVAVVGHNIVPVDETYRTLYPQALGIGAAFTYDIVAAGFDTVLDFTSHPDKEVKPSFHGGAELFFAKRYALRGGAMHDTLRESTYVTGGLAFVVKKAGVEFGLRQQVDGGSETLISFALNLFVQ